MLGDKCSFLVNSEKRLGLIKRNYWNKIIRGKRETHKRDFISKRVYCQVLFLEHEQGKYVEKYRKFKMFFPSNFKSSVYHVDMHKY